MLNECRCSCCWFVLFLFVFLFPNLTLAETIKFDDRVSFRHSRESGARSEALKRYPGASIVFASKAALPNDNIDKSQINILCQADPEETNAEGGSLWPEEDLNGMGDDGSGSLWEEESLFDDEGADLTEESFESNWNFGLRVWNKMAFDTEDDDDFESDFYNHVKVIPSVEYRASDRLYFKAGVQGDYFLYHYDKGWENDDDFRFHDTYVNFSGPGYNAKIGNQVVRWGKTDGFSPLDNINPEDFRDGIAGRREDRKIPVPMMNIQAYRGPFTFQGIFIPFFFKSELDIVGTDWALFKRVGKEIGPFSYDDPDFSADLDDSQVGARIAATIRGFDIALSYLDKINDLPSINSLATPPGFILVSESILDLPRFAQATGQTINLKYDRTSIWGLELETAVGSVVFRADLAYNDSVNFLTDTLDSIEKSVFDYLVGFDYNSPDNFYVNLQFGQRIIDDWDDRIIFAKDITSTISGTVSRELYNGNFKPELRFYYDLEGDASIFNPRILIYYWQNLTVDIGVEFFDGKEWNIIGTYENNDQVYALLKAMF